MGFDKAREFRMWGVSNQNSTARFVTGDTATGFTAFTNPLRGTLMWDDCCFILRGVSVVGGATGGSYTVTIQTDAVRGYTGLPIARSTIGPNTTGTVVMDNLHKGTASALPTHIFVNQTAAGGGIFFQCFALARQYRGVLGIQGAFTSERIIQGNLIRGTSTGGVFASDRGFVADATVTLGTSGSALGMHRLHLWDHAMYWVVAGNSVSGTHDVNIVGRIGGNTVITASTGVAGAVTAAGDKVAIPSLIYGMSPNPTQIIWDTVSAGGVSDARVVVLAKTGRGSLMKN